MDPKTYREEMLEKMRGVESFGTANIEIDREGVPSDLNHAGIEDVDALIKRTEDSKQAVKDRLAALEAINRIAFDQQAFKDHNARYVKLLKQLRSDHSSMVRRAAFERLSLSMDLETRRMLQDSLSADGEPLVPDTMAAALLGSDDHASSRDVLRNVVKNGEDAVRQVALRGLAADSKSASLLEKIATDQNEPPEMREAATLSLKIASPKRFAGLVKKLATDSTNDDQLRAKAISSLAHSTEALENASSKAFLSQLDEVSKGTRSRALKSSIKHLKSRAE